MTIQTKLVLWWTWLNIAVKNTASAQNARYGSVAPLSFESAGSAGLSAEFEHSLTAIAAVSFALEALSKDIEGSGHILDKSLLSPPGKTNAGFYVAHRIIQAFALSGPLASTLPKRTEDLFSLRNDSVHFDSVYRVGAHPHPSGTNTAYELTLWTLESATEAVQLCVAILRACAAAVASNRHSGRANGAAAQVTGTTVMLDELLRSAAIRGLV